MLLHVLDGVAEPGVRLDLPLFELLVHPLREAIHQRPALGLMETQPLLGCHAALSGESVFLEDVAERLEDEACPP